MEVEINDYIGVFRGAASDDYCDRMVAKFDELMSLDSSGSMNGELQFGSAVGRKDLSFFFDDKYPELAEETNRILDSCLEPYMDEYVGLKQESFGSNQVKVQRTPPKGGYHVWHAEHGGCGSYHTATRMLVWTLYLNDIPEGQGETEFLHQGIRLQPQKGMVCLFPASWTHYHRGNFTTTATKYIATGWYNYM